MRLVIIALLLLVSARAGAQAATVQVPVLLHMAQENGADVAPEAFIQDQLAHANVIFEPLGIELVIAGRRKASAARMVSREDRDALGAARVQGVINWFVVAQLMDVDEPGRERRGVHWHVRATPSNRYVILSAISGSFVFAHELGHFFGNPAHSEVVGNLMSYQHTEAVPVLDDAQQANVARTLRRMRARGELLPLQKARRTLGSPP